MTRLKWMLSVLAVCLACIVSDASPLDIHIKADKSTIGMGRTVVISAEARMGAIPAAGRELWPLVNGRRWGASVITNRYGKATMPLPLPNPGRSLVTVCERSKNIYPEAWWIWDNSTTDNQTVFFGRSFTVKQRPIAASLLITCDDQYHLYLNGRPIVHGTNFKKIQAVKNIAALIKPGINTLSVEAINGTEPAGLLFRLDIKYKNSSQVVCSDTDWRVSSVKPANWPSVAPSRESSGAAVKLAKVGEGVWGSSISGWPGMSPKSIFPTGEPGPKDAATSNKIVVNVKRRPIKSKIDPAHRIGMEWEPWFTPLNARWETAEAVPVVGYYASVNSDVIRQHAIWMTEAGIDFILVDWTNNLWDKKHWSERAPGVNELIDGTTTMLDVYAQMRKEGIDVPQVMLILGYDNGPKTTMVAVNEQMRWIYDKYVKNPKYRGLWLKYQGKPLITVFNGGGPGSRVNEPPVDESEFTVRWMASQLQFSQNWAKSYWSWMDGALKPMPTICNRSIEALTVTIAYFANGGWTYPEARGHLGGTTYCEEMNAAMEYRPRFLVICQWNEFAGQPNGSGYGDKHDQYFDSYSSELSNDIEPTSLTAIAYRGEPGWGYFYLNLTRALMDNYKRPSPIDTIVTIAEPLNGSSSDKNNMKLAWSVAGKQASTFSVACDGQTVKSHITDRYLDLDLSELKPGRHSITVRAEGAVTRWKLDVNREDDPYTKPIPAGATVWFTMLGVR